MTDFILSDYFLLDHEQGGRNALLLGAPGQGKTSLIQYLTYLACRGKDFHGNPREKQAAIWRARGHDRYLEFMNLGIGVLAVPEGSDFTLVKVYDTRQEAIDIQDLEDEGIPYFRYSSPQDILAHMEPGKVICILFAGSGTEETQFYADLFEALVARRDNQWIHIAIDEADDILPPYSQESYKVQAQFVRAVNDFRKRYINSIFATHDYRNLDYRIRPKTPWHIYKRGAKRLPGESGKLKQDYINSLQISEAHITFGAFFDLFSFPAPPKGKRLDFSLQTEYRRFDVTME